MASSLDASPRRLSWKAKLVLVCFGLLFTCVLLEIGLRVSAGIERRRAAVLMGIHETGRPTPGPIFDPDLAYRPNPNLGDSNSDGLRDYPIGPKGGRFRVLFLGDSVAVYGDSIDDTFVGYLRAELAKHPASRPTEVINGGITGYTNYQELLFLKKYGLKFQPDLAGVEFCLNDLHKLLHAYELENGRLAPTSYFSSDSAPRVVTRSWSRRLARKSYLLAWARSHLHLQTLAAEWRARRGFSFDYNPDYNNAWKDAPWKEIETQFGDAVQLGRQNYFSIFVVVVPLAAQYNSDYLVRDRDYVLKPQRKLRELCARLGIHFLDLYPDLNTQMFIEDGLHLNKAGRQLVGRRIAAFLTESNLIPAELSPQRAEP